MSISFEDRLGCQPKALPGALAKDYADTFLYVGAFAIGGYFTPLRKGAVLGFGTGFVWKAFTHFNSPILRTEARDHFKELANREWKTVLPYENLCGFALLAVILRFIPLDLINISRIAGFCFGWGVAAALRPLVLVWTDPVEDRKAKKADDERYYKMLRSQGQPTGQSAAQQPITILNAVKVLLGEEFNNSAAVNFHRLVGKLEGLSGLQIGADSDTPKVRVAALQAMTFTTDRTRALAQLTIQFHTSWVY